MNARFRDALLILGIDPDAPADPAAAIRVAEKQVGRALPGAVVELLRFPGVIPAIAEGIGGHAVFPVPIELHDGSYMPEVKSPMLMLMYENQGVVVWGVPLDQGDDPPILVGYGRQDREPAFEYSPNMAEFVYALAWEGRVWDGSPMLYALAAPLDTQTLESLRSRYRELTQSRGWPPECTVYRFAGDGGLQIMLLAGPRQCDWYVSADNPEVLAAEVRWLMSLSNLRRAFESHQDEGEALLARLRADPD